ncbi:MAG: ATP-binding protein [Proteobacteria bacterium]|nr:ATP-binding protein [Pseudomonadota bacterium]MCH9735778.1 ATP-binding protein [Actinomycetes bacterium]
MAKPVVGVIGESGTGKSSMFETLPSDRTILINAELKPLPIKNFRQFKNVMTDTYKKITTVIKQLGTDDGAKYDYAVLDSFTSLTEIVNKYASTAFNGYEVWAMYNQMIVDVIWDLKKLPQQVFIIALPEQKAMEFGETKSYARVKGKELKYGYLEKELAVVLFTNPVHDDETGEMLDVHMHYKANKFNTAKSPRGMFDGVLKNDALDIANKVEAYYGSD